MAEFPRKSIDHQQKSQRADEDTSLTKFYTDTDHAIQVFEQLVSATNLPKRLLVIHGVGGVGKSSLLRMYRLHCKSIRLPVALASGEEAESALAVLSNWADDLKADDTKLPIFAKTLKHLRVTQAKVEEQVRQVTEMHGKMADFLGKTTGKAAESAASTIVGAAIGSIIPGIGSFAGALGGMGVEALVDWLRGFLSKSDMDLLLDPEKKLTEDFLKDISQVAPKRRLVLMLDTYEQMTALDKWVCDLIRRMHPNALVVIAGREVPHWGRAWPGWLAQAHVEAIEPMSEEDMRTLVHRYYAHIQGGQPDTKQVEAIISFARGLPMVVNSAVQLWVERGLEDFQMVKPEVVADLVDRLMEGVPPAMIPAIEAAAVLRWFNKEVLRAMLGQTDVNEVYNELRRFPFVLSRAEGLMLHDTVREVLDENLHVHDPERYRELHEHAATYFEAQIAKRSGKEAEQLILERFYHLIPSGAESTAIAESQVAIEVALGFYHLLFAESIITLLDQNLKEVQSRCWLAYFRWLLTKTDPQIEKQILACRALVEMLNQPDLDPRLWALVAIELTAAPVEANIALDKRLNWAERAVGSANLSPQEKARGHLNLARVYRGGVNWTKSIEEAKQTIQAYDQLGNLFGKILAMESLAYSYLLMGEWNNAIKWAAEEVTLSRQMGGYSLTNALNTLGWAHLYNGELTLARSFIEEGLALTERYRQEGELLLLTRRLAEVYDRENRWSVSNSLYQDLIEKDKKLGRVVSMATKLALLGYSYVRQGLQEKAEKLLIESLAHIHYHAEQIALNGLGELYLVRGRLNDARRYYERCLSVSKGRPYYEVQSRLGLLQVDIASLAFQEIVEKTQQIEEISDELGYNDHLASLRLIQGHIVWDGPHTDPPPHLGEDWERALRFYQEALIYALRYNRFLLDEMLSGRPQGTPLQSIILHCLERGEQGSYMLTNLRNWWQSGNNNIGMPRLDTISPIPEGIPLLEAEHIARQRELGDGSPQKSVLEQINAALTMANRKEKHFL